MCFPDSSELSKREYLWHGLWPLSSSLLGVFRLHQKFFIFSIYLSHLWQGTTAIEKWGWQQRKNVCPKIDLSLACGNMSSAPSLCLGFLDRSVLCCSSTRERGNTEGSVNTKCQCSPGTEQSLSLVPEWRWIAQGSLNFLRVMQLYILTNNRGAIMVKYRQWETSKQGKYRHNRFIVLLLGYISMVQHMSSYYKLCVGAQFWDPGFPKF